MTMNSRSDRNRLRVKNEPNVGTDDPECAKSLGHLSKAGIRCQSTVVKLAAPREGHGLD